MSEHNFKETESVTKSAETARLIEEVELFAKDDATLIEVDESTDDTHSETETNVSANDEYTHLSISPHQFVRNKSGKYEPTVRPNFWIPVIYLLAGIIPYALYFGAAYFIEPYYLPKPFPESPPAINGHNGTLTAFLYCIHASIPSAAGELIALFLLKKRGLPPWLAITIWLLLMIILCVVFVGISIADASTWVNKFTHL